MMDKGLMLAVAAVGTTTELARRLGIKQQSLHQWRRVPAHRIIAVEAATGVDRAVLRPDLYQRKPEPKPRKGRRKQHSQESR